MALNLSALLQKGKDITSRINTSALSGISKIKQETKEFFEPTEDVRVRDVFREAGILTRKVFKTITPTEEDIYNKESFEKTGIGVTRFGEIAYRNPKTGNISYTDTIMSVGSLKNVAKEGIEKVAKELTSIVKSKKLDKKLIEIAQKPFKKTTLDIKALKPTKELAPLAQEARKLGEVSPLKMAGETGRTFQDLLKDSPAMLKGRTGFTIPPKTVTIYKGVSKSGLPIKTGDWVTTNKGYAKQFGKVLEKLEVPAEELRYMRGAFKGNAIGEYPEYILTQATKGVKSLEKIFKAPGKAIQAPTVIQGETFSLGTGRLTQPTTKELKATQKLEIKATKKEIKFAEIAQKKAKRLEVRQQKTRTDTLENLNRQHGNTDIIVKQLKKRHLSDEDIANVILEDGTKLTDTLKVKRNPDKSLAAIIKKSDIEDIKLSYSTKVPIEKWTKIGVIGKVKETALALGKLYELPQVWFERKGLNKINEPVIEAGRAAEYLKTSFINKFREAGLWKNQGWFTADRFDLSSREAEGIGKYFLTRQNKGYNVLLKNLSEKSKKFVKIFDDIINETEQQFYDVARKNGKTPGRVENYAPIMTREDIELADKAGAMDFIFRKHPAFFSLKERAKKVPVKLYETDYRKIAARWMDGITEFLNIGEVTPEIKYLIDSDQFKKIVTEKDYAVIHKWLKDVVNPQIPETAGGEAVDFTARLLKKGAAMASLGLNYASVVKQALTQVPLMLIRKARPKLRSEYAKAFGISVKDLPSITKRKGDIAITDLQGKVGRIFTGALTEFDRKNAQLSVNALLDKEYGKFLKEGAEITPQVQNIIEKKAQDTIDLWYGGFFKGQKPEAFRSSLGQFINMFIYPLTSQLNGFYRHILQSKGAGKTAVATAEVMAAATTIAYMEVAISKLSFNWSDEKQMAKDVLQSLGGNIPIVSQLSYALMNDQQLQVSAGLSGIANLLKKIPQYAKGEKEVSDILFAGAEIVGLPKQVRRIREGVEIINEGGITNKEGKMLAPVKEADEIIRAILRGKYGPMASQDWIRNIGEKTENRRWFVPQVEFLQNGDYNRKAELYKQFTLEEQKELKNYLSETQQKKLDKALSETKPSTGGSLEEIFGGTSEKKSLDDIFE